MDVMHGDYIDIKDAIPDVCTHPEPTDRIKFFYCWVCRSYYDLKDGKYEPRSKEVK